MSNTATIYPVKLNYQSAVSLLLAHQNGLLSGDGAPERVRLYEAVLDHVREHEKSKKPESEFSADIKIASGTVKAWLAGAANSIMRRPLLANGTPMNDMHVHMLVSAARALGFAGELLKRVPAFNAGEDLLERDEEPAELERDDAPVADLAPSEGSAVAESSAPAVDAE